MTSMAAPGPRIANDAEWTEAALRLERARALLGEPCRPRTAAWDDGRSPEEVAAQLKVLANEVATIRAPYRRADAG